MNSSVALPRSDAKFDSVEGTLGIKVSDLNLGWGTALTAHLEVGERISELGVYRAGDGLHAEEHLLEELEAYWDEYAEKELENTIVIKITRSPCGENSHNCSGQLAAFISDKKQEGWSVRLDLSVMTLHGGMSKKSRRPLNQGSYMGLKELAVLDEVSLKAWDVLEILKKKTDMTEIEAEVGLRLERRIQEVKNVLGDLE